MKKRFRWLFALLAVCMVISMLPLQAMAAPETYTDEYGVWTYEVEADGSITIVAFQSARKNIAVPAKIGGKPVRKLGDGLFQNRNDLTMIVIPYGITTIGNDVFSGCEKLETVTLPQSLTSIGDGAFANCASLGELFIPSSVTELGDKVFADSPKIDVHCDLNSTTAAYLKENKDDVAGFTLIEVQEKPAVTVPETNGSTAAVTTKENDTAATIKGKLVTYEFGKTFANGRREYTLVLADAMPDMDPNEYVKTYSNGYQELDQAIYEVLWNRFQLVSITQYDGTNTVDVTPQGVDGICGVGAWIVGDNDGDHFRYDVQYQIALGLDDYMAGGLGYLEFSSTNELVAYECTAGKPQGSLVKLDTDEYVFYNLDNCTTKRYYADGERAYDKTIRDSYAHKVAVGGSCVDISIRLAVDNDTSATESSKYVGIINENGVNTHTANLWSNGKDNNLEKDVYVETPDSMESANVRYNGSSSQPDEVHHTAITPNGNGTYTIENSHYNAQNSWHGEHKENDWYYVYDATESDIVYHSEQVVRADNVSEAQQHTNAQFPNEPDEHTYDVSEKTVNTWTHSEAGTWTDPDSNKANYTNSIGNTQLSDHTYIGDTGKYVGWDWEWVTWNHQETNTTTGDTHTGSGSNYTVTEYKYSKSEESGETWTKTTVWVTPKENTDASIDVFKQDYTSGNLDNYYVSSSDYVFDPTTESGADNWKWVEDPVTTYDDAAAIALGNTSVTDGEGTVIKQQEAKEDMVELANEVQNTAKVDTTEEIFDKAVEELEKVDPDIGTIMENVENASENGTITQGNTGDIVEHYHDFMNGTVTTVVTPDPAAPAAQSTSEAPTAQSAAETPAQQPAAETPAEQPAEQPAEAE